MLKPILLVSFCVAWLILVISAPAEAVERVGDPPPMLATTDMVKLLGSAAIAVGGLALVVWSLRPRRR
jgi:hypothetical protein